MTGARPGGGARPSLAPLLLAILLSGACQGGAAETLGSQKSTKTGGQGPQMNIQRIGRFSLAVPAEMKQVAQRYQLRFTDMEEVTLPAGAGHDAARSAAWEKRLGVIKVMKPPEEETRVLVETKSLTDAGRSLKAAFYFGDPLTNLAGYWDLLLDAGPVAIWFRIVGRASAKDEMLAHLLEMARAYRLAGPAGGTAADAHPFYLRHGLVALPHDGQEKTYVRFEGHPLGLKLEVETSSTAQPETTGLSDRLLAVVSSGYAEGVHLDRLKGGERPLAGLEGEEAIIRVTSDGEKSLTFAWEYPGKKESGDFPEMRITMEGPDGRTEEKTAIWDQVLKSLQPVGR